MANPGTENYQVSIICPHCYHRMTGRVDWIGRKGQCKCGGVVEITGAACSEKIFAGREELKESTVVFLKVLDTSLNTIQRGGTLRDVWINLPKRILKWMDDEWRLCQIFRSISSLTYSERNLQSVAKAGVDAYYWRATGKPCSMCSPFVGHLFPLDGLDPIPPWAHFGCKCWIEVVFDGERVSTQPSGPPPNPEYESAQRKPGACRRPKVPLPDSRDLDNLQVLLHWAEYARQLGWELITDPYEEEELDPSAAAKEKLDPLTAAKESGYGYPLVNQAYELIDDLDESDATACEKVRSLLIQSLEYQISPNTEAKVCRTLGAFAEEDGKKEDAIQWYERALENNPRVGVKQHLKKLRKG